MNKTLITILFVALLAPSLALAQEEPKPAATEYTLLAPVPQLAKDAEGKTDAVTYITGLFKLIVGLAGVLAVIMLIYAGIKYMSTDAFSGKDEAKGIIENAMWGLGLAIAAWLILYTINPKLVEIKFDIPKQEITTTTLGGGIIETGKTLPGYKLTWEQVVENNEIKKRLENNDPKVRVNGGPCTNGEIRGCTNLVLLPTSAIDGVINLATQCQASMHGSCNVIITGGAEGGHVTHGPGKSQVDLGLNLTLNKYITEQGKEVYPRSASCSRIGPQFQVGSVIYTNEITHWHACY